MLLFNIDSSMCCCGSDDNPRCCCGNDWMVGVFLCFLWQKVVIVRIIMASVVVVFVIVVYVMIIITIAVVVLIICWITSYTFTSLNIDHQHNNRINSPYKGRRSNCNGMIVIVLNVLIVAFVFDVVLMGSLCFLLSVFVALVLDVAFIGSFFVFVFVVVVFCCSSVLSLLS